MDFFDRQAQAQRKTSLLVFYFACAVVTIIVVLQIVFAELSGDSWFDLQLLGEVAGSVIAVVTLGSVVKIIELSQGGRVVAAMLGGQQIVGHTTDLAEQKLLNVVEEMSIASGVPMPEVYVLPDETINAFAAGHGPGDAAIGVTRGCIEKLSRDELQGVIAHEFSHLLHGDMKLNLRLIGVLNGILFLAIIGGVIMRMTAYSRGGSSRDKGNGALIMLAAGLALYLVGWIGVFFGNLIKAAVSRQREFLADASAVQYTRNPAGIAGALWKIGKFASKLESPQAPQASHLFFGNGLADPWWGAFATHPPLEERIKAIDPQFEPPAKSTPPPMPGEVAAKSPAVPVYDKLSGLLMAAVAPFANDAVRDLHDSCAFVYALLLDEEDAARETQLRGLEVEDSIRQTMLGFFARRGEIPAAQRLPLVDLAIPTLRNLSPEQYAVFRKNVRHLVESDQAIQLFEFALQKTLVRHLDLYFTRSTGAKVKYLSLAPVLPDVGALLSGLAFVGQADEAARDAAFAAGVKMLDGSSLPPLTRDKACDLARIDTALDRVAQVAPALKRTILEAGRETVSQDGKVDLQEYELLRAIADTLDCPMPPLTVAS